MPMDGRTDICSCNICTSTIHGGRMTQGAMEGGDAQDVIYVVVPWMAGDGRFL